MSKLHDLYPAAFTGSGFFRKIRHRLLEMQRIGQRRKGNNMEKNHTHIGYIDTFRGIGIMLMIIGHTEISWVVNTYIHSFHMPMFFFVSGFLYREKRPWRLFVIKKARTLLVPYIAFGMMAITIVYFGKPSVFPQKRNAFLLYSTEEYPLATAMWFPMALFICNIVYDAIDRVVEDPMAKNSIIIVLAVFGEVFTKATKIVLPYAIGPALVGVGLMHIGKLLKRYERDILSLNPCTVSVLAASGVFLAFKEGFVSMRSGTYPRVVLFWITAAINIVVVLRVSAYLDHRFKQSVFNKYLVKVAQDSMAYVVMNQQCIKLSEALTTRFLSKRIQKPVSLLASLGLLYVCAEAINRTRLRKLIGRK